MKKQLFGLVAVISLAIMLLIGGCKLSSTGPSYTEYAIQVDSIQYPDTVTYGNPLIIKFYGTIGTSTCYSFSRFAGNYASNQINVQVLGKYMNNQSNCATALQYLNGDSLAVTQYNSGNFVIHVLQPSPPDIYDTLYITKASPTAEKH